MDVKLDSLIEKIKKDGIEEGQKTADELIQTAKKEAAAIIAKAKKEAEKIIDDGNKQAEKLRSNAEADIKQAGRDAELLLKEKIVALFDNVFKKEVATALKPEFVSELIKQIVAGWVKNNKADVVINEQDQQQLEKLLFAGINNELRNTIFLRVSQDISTGFRIGLKDEQVYYDFTDRTFAELLKTLINPKLKAILEK